MSVTSLSTGRRPPDSDRRPRILEAAEHAFVRNGFHATTMQHVADEAGMSPGNLYRYFPSKEAIVEGLCELDQARRAESFAAFGAVMARNGDLTEAMLRGLRDHVFKSPGKARLIVEIWAEAGRNARVAEISRAIDAEALIGLEQLMELAKATGAASARLDSRFGALFFFTFVTGIFKRIAVEPDFDPESEAEAALGVLKALFAGALSSAPREPNGEAR